MIRSIWLYLSLSMILVACSASKQIAQNPSEKSADMVFEKDFFDLGEVKKGDTREVQFKFTNAGSEALEIEIVTACDCTTLEWPRLPIAPGDGGVIDAVFHSINEKNEKTVDITIVLKNTDQRTGYPLVEEVSYKALIVE